MIEWLKKNDILNKSLCLLAAMLLWFYVVSVQNPEKSVDVKNVKVTLTGKEQLLSLYGLSVIEEKNPTVTIKVSGRREKIAQVSADKILVTASLSSIDSAGEYAIPYQPSVLVDGLSVAGRSPAAVTVKVDKIVTASVPVKANVDTEAETGYILGTQEISPQSVTIKGPQAEIANVSYALIFYAQDKKLTSGIDENFDYKLFGSNGKEIASSHIEKVTASVNLKIPVSAFKEVPFSVSLVSAPGIDSAYATAEIYPAVIDVTGENSQLAALEQIYLGSISLAGKQDGAVVTLPVALPDGLSNVNGTQSVKVTIHLQGIETRTYTASQFEIISDPEDQQNYDFSVKTGPLDVYLRGQRSVLDSITNEMLILIVDLRGMDILPETTAVTAPVSLIITGNPDVGLVDVYSADVDVVPR